MTDDIETEPLSVEKLDLPSISLIFSIDEREWPDTTEEPWDTLLTLADRATDAIEAADPRFSILKAFTFYAGKASDSDRRLLQKVRELAVDPAGKSARMLARDILEVLGVEEIFGD